MKFPRRIVDFDQCDLYHAAIDTKFCMYVWGQTNPADGLGSAASNTIGGTGQAIIIHHEGIQAIKCSRYHILVLADGVLWNYHFTALHGTVHEITPKRVSVELNGRITSINCQCQYDMAIISGHLAVWDAYSQRFGVTQSLNYNKFLDNGCGCAYVRGPLGIHSVPWAWRTPFVEPIGIPAGISTGNDIWMVAGVAYERVFATSSGIVVMITEESIMGAAITIRLDVSAAIDWK
jgi:hypothetical protein